VTKQVEASENILIDVFECIENLLRNLGVHTKVPPTPAMKDTMMKMMAEVLDILGMATKQSRASEFVFLLTSPEAYCFRENSKGGCGNNETGRRPKRLDMKRLKWRLRRH